MRFQVHLAVAAISITFLQLSGVCSHVTPATSGCEPGHAEGDKWFDGCRWCVCENSVHVCSSSACSELNAQLPPCQSVGSSWWDGCYRCTCLTDGIECTADRTCVGLIKSERFQTKEAYMLSQGACLKPQDNRCICGVDGVPSCTADAIDRNAVQAKTILLRPSIRQRQLSRMRSRSPALASRRSSSAPMSRSRRSAYPTSPSLAVGAGDSPSLLVSTDNRCRWGSRWYGGGLRCYCDKKGSITCGDPQFVASSIDGFLMDRTPCLAGEDWKEPLHCRYCECHVSGVALCWRSEKCPYPFVIEPVLPSVEPALDSNGDSSASENGDESAYEPDPEENFLDNGQRESLSSNTVNESAAPEQEIPGSGDDSNAIPISADRPLEVPNRLVNLPAVYSTNVIVRECQPGDTWKENGCRRCRCNQDGKKECTDRFCLIARVHRPPAASPAGDRSSELTRERIGDQVVGRPAEHLSSGNFHPLPPVHPEPTNPCEPYKLNEIFHPDSCNMCKCTRAGPMCTAMSCS
ncbi:hypothetical protein EGW08_007499 [Elysia chlorotica]|uniref:Pacifastin domain-containing protein n=1 Tax=Elysia chlorotica TaxID=188477 RepID=A0A3S1C742_ELYCH|nr:hypothetical protein EGW08_007499 [Elysia chlorotica]